MNLQKNYEPRGQLPDTENDWPSTQPPHSHKASTPSPDPLLRKSKLWGSIANNYPRSRTATTTSLPSDVYLNYTVSADKPAARDIQRIRSSGSVTPRPERVENLAKALFARGSRLLKRQNSKLDSVSLRTLEWLEGSGTNMGKHKSHSPGLHPDYKRESMYSMGNGNKEFEQRIFKANVCNPDMSTRRHISQPYNFQHLTHTHAKQFPALHKTSHTELVSEFSAIRASQIPRRHLQGIRAESLQHRTPSEASSESSSPTHNHPTSPSQLSLRMPEGEPFHGSQHNLGSLPYPRLVENFSQPNPKSYKPRPSPITPPPRMSSKKSRSELSPGLDDALNSPPLYIHPSSVGSAASDIPPLVSPAYVSVDWEDDLFDYSTTPHAVSTPDMTAFALKPLPFGNLEKELPRLPEEIEAPDEKSPRLSSIALRLRPNLHPAKSFPSTKSSSRRWSRTSSRVSPDGLVSPVFDGPPLAEAVIPSIDQPFDDIPFGPRLSRQISSDSANYDESWEDDIDYCYEHAAEADCDFDWDRISSGDEKTAIPPNDADLEVDPPPPSSPDRFESNSRTASTNPSDIEPRTDRPLPFYLPPLRLSITESPLSSRDSSKSSTLSINGPVTPSRSILSPQLNLPFRTAKDSSLSSVLIPRDIESQFIPEELYQRLLASDHISEQVYPFHHINFDTVSSKDNSPRSSHSQMSKYASQESFVLAHSTSVCHHRDNESVGSVPELVHSRWNSQSSDLAINRPERIAASSIVAISAPCNQPDKPLPLRPIPDESETVCQSVVSHGIMCDQSPIGPEDQTLVALHPRVSPTFHRDRGLSDAAVRFLGDLPKSAPAITTAPRRVKSTNSIAIQPVKPPSSVRAPSIVFLSTPF